MNTWSSILPRFRTVFTNLDLLHSASFHIDSATTTLPETCFLVHHCLGHAALNMPLFARSHSQPVGNTLLWSWRAVRICLADVSARTDHSSRSKGWSVRLPSQESLNEFSVSVFSYSIFRGVRPHCSSRLGLRWWCVVKRLGKRLIGEGTSYPTESATRFQPKVRLDFTRLTRGVPVLAYD